MTKMTSNKPYLIKALYDWIVDNDLTPYVLVNAEYPNVQVPQEHVNEGRIVLNISPKACRGLHLENDRIVFTARFSGKSVQIFVVPAAVLAIYAKENGRGMEFGDEYSDEPPPPPLSPRDLKNRAKPALTLVKKE
ncbi:MAG: ClpXP protease specificity-enhancing factor [Tatlockia sp.]|nr:ClpXP protease specificity-enhancing factor [Tatlockia sp.]